MSQSIAEAPAGQAIRYYERDPRVVAMAKHLGIEIIVRRFKPGDLGSSPDDAYWDGQRLNVTSRCPAWKLWHEFAHWLIAWRKNKKRLALKNYGYEYYKHSAFRPITSDSRSLHPSPNHSAEEGSACDLTVLLMTRAGYRKCLISRVANETGTLPVRPTKYKRELHHAFGQAVA